MRWVIGILVVVVLVIIGYQYFGREELDVAEQPGVTEEQADVAEPAEQAAAETEQAAEEAATATEQAGEQAAESAEQAADAAGEAAEQAGETAEEAAAGAEQATEEAAGATEQAAEQAEQTAEQAATATGQAGQQAAGAAGQAANEAEEAAEATAPAAGPATQEQLTEAQVAALTVGDVNVGEQLTGAVQSVEDALQGIDDAQSAEAAVPQLNAVNTRLEELSGTVDQLPDDAKKVLADVLSERVTELKTLAAEVTAKEGVGAVVNPALEPLMAKLEGWSQQPA